MYMPKQHMATHRGMNRTLRNSCSNGFHLTLIGSSLLTVYVLGECIFFPCLITVQDPHLTGIP